MANLGLPERVMFVLAVSRFAVAPRRFAIATSPYPPSPPTPPPSPSSLPPLPQPKCLRAAYIIVLPTASQDTALDTNLSVGKFRKINLPSGRSSVDSPCSALSLEVNTLTPFGCLYCL